MPHFTVRLSVHDIREVIIEAPTEKEALARAEEALNNDGHAGTLLESDVLACSADQVIN